MLTHNFEPERLRHPPGITPEWENCARIRSRHNPAVSVLPPELIYFFDRHPDLKRQFIAALENDRKLGLV